MGAMITWLQGERRSVNSIAALTGDAPAASTGRAVTPGTAVGSASVWACVRVLAESVATLPLHVYRREARGRERLPGHPVSVLLHDAPNPRQTAVEFREQAMAGLLLWGNAYAWIERWPSGRAKALWPLRPDRVTVRSAPGADPLPELAYAFRGPGGEVVFPATDVLHVRGLSSDGLAGLSPVSVHRETIAVEAAEREFAGRFFGGSARPGGILKHPGKLTPDAAGRLKASWEAAHRGLDQAHRVAVLEEGVEWASTSLPLADAEFVAQRRFSLEEVARIFRVPPHLIGDLTRSTYNNIEHQALDFAVHSLRPWLVRLEQAYARSLLFADERRDLYVEHVLDGLLRGDVRARYEAYAVGRQWGWLSANEIRERENLNSVDDGDGYLTPLNYGTGGEAVARSVDGAVATVTPVVGGSSGGRALPAGHEGDVLAGLGLRYDALDIPGIAVAIREAIGDER